MMPSYYNIYSSYFQQFSLIKTIFFCYTKKKLIYLLGAFMKTTLLLIRHGETNWNVLGKFQGRQNIELSEAGILQATLLEKRLTKDFHAVYSSPLDRAFSTAEVLCKNLPLDPVPIEDLTEIHFGTWEGLTYREIEQFYPEHFMHWRTDEKTAPMYDGELSIKGKGIDASIA